MLLNRALTSLARNANNRTIPAAMVARRWGGGGGPDPRFQDPRWYLTKEGTREFTQRESMKWTPSLHHTDPLTNNPPFITSEENGQKFIHPLPKASLQEIHSLPEGRGAEMLGEIPMWGRHRMEIWGNYKLVMKAEFLFFYIPTVLVVGLCIPAFTMMYALEEAVYTTMTVKVVGRQWYWVYEIESPTDDDDE